MIWKVLIHNVIEKAKEHFPETAGVAVTGTGVVMDVIGWVSNILEVVVKLGYIAVSIMTVVYLVQKARNLNVKK